MKLEIGGGNTPRGEGFVNLDCLPCADIAIDLEKDPLPFADDSVDQPTAWSMSTTLWAFLVRC